RPRGRGRRGPPELRCLGRARRRRRRGRLLAPRRARSPRRRDGRPDPLLASARGRDRPQPRARRRDRARPPWKEGLMATRTYGTMGVDWEQRVDFDRLRRERLARAKQFLAESDLGALLCFDMNNIRYLTATHIGTWAFDKLIRFCLLTRDSEPILWDFGSAARHHAIYCPWLDGDERSRAGISTLRGAVEGRAESVAEKIKVELEQRGLLGEHVEGVNAISGERCAPHPHVFTDRMLRPGDPAYFDILHAYNGYRTCYYRTFAVGSASQALVDAYKRCRDILDRSIAMVKPGVT